MIGVTAIATGAYGVLTGSGGIVGGEQASPTVESELRYFTVFWIAYGVAALWVVPRVEREGALVRALALVMFAGGVARGIAWIASGQPHALFIVLMGLELLIPLLLVLLIYLPSRSGRRSRR